MSNNLKAERLSPWGSRTEIIYLCRNCGTSFGFYGDKELFCHNCGTKNLWEGIPTHVSEKLSKIYHSANYEEQREIISELQKKIDEIADEVAKKE